ncbi:hypothetical protein [Kitasatospora sp. GP82]|uniref:hypothetical protein n=1 Tax=Kitasatospora sp. GP82 TaxID=3035089 RepID=UPI002473F137|nr:hypothetical protein [Kitasatospora sp. GP82]MDH6125873.1 hypothetical protein [Kitasatospora sp. GP82]
MTQSFESETAYESLVVNNCVAAYLPEELVVNNCVAAFMQQDELVVNNCVMAYVI